MKNACVLLALLTTAVTGGERCVAQPPEVKELIAAVAKLKGYTENTRTDSKQQVLRIRFFDSGPKDADLATLRPLMQKSPLPLALNLNQNPAITEAGVASLADLENLIELRLGGTKVADAGLKHLAGLNNLEDLYLDNDEITDAGLVHLAKLTKLRKLSVHSKKVTDAGYAHLAGLTQLEAIQVGSGSEKGDTCLEHMKGMTRLKELSIGRDKLTDAGMAHLKNFTELRSLRIEAPKVTQAGVANLAALTKLEKLTVLSCYGFNGEGMAALKDLAGLREFELIYSGAPDKTAVAHLGKLTGLKKLRLGSVRDEALEGLKGLTKLEELDLNYSSIGDEGLKHLSGLTSLRDLNLYATRVTDAGLKHLSGLTNLKTLYLTNNKPITDEGVKHLAGLTKLEQLSLEDCKVAGASLKNLAGLTSLKTLWLNGNPVTDAGVMDLKNLRALKDLYLTGTKVSDEAALELKKARPDLRILDASGDEVKLTNNAPARPKIVVEDLSKIAPAFTLTAEKFFAEYKADGQAAAKKYKGQVIELSGTAKSFGRNFSGEFYIALDVEKDLIGVMCFTADAQPWTKAVPGQKIKIKGKFPEQSFATTLIHCAFVETGTYLGIPLTAAALAKEYAANPDATKKKYDKKYLVVTGEVEKKEYNSAGAAGIQLKVDGKVRVVCSVTAFEKDLTKPIKVGQTIKLIGEYTLNFGNDEIHLYFCLPIKEN